MGDDLRIDENARGQQRGSIHSRTKISTVLKSENQSAYLSASISYCGSWKISLSGTVNVDMTRISTIAGRKATPHIVACISSTATSHSGAV